MSRVKDEGPQRKYVDRVRGCGEIPVCVPCMAGAYYCHYLHFPAGGYTGGYRWVQVGTDRMFVTTSRQLDDGQRGVRGTAKGVGCHHLARPVPT